MSSSHFTFSLRYQFRPMPYESAALADTAGSAYESAPPPKALSSTCNCCTRALISNAPQVPSLGEKRVFGWKPLNAASSPVRNHETANCQALVSTVAERNPPGKARETSCETSVYSPRTPRLPT